MEFFSESCFFSTVKTNSHGDFTFKIKSRNNSRATKEKNKTKRNKKFGTKRLKTAFEWLAKTPF